MASQERIMLMIHASPTQVSTGKGMTALTGSIVQHGVSGSTCSSLQDVHTPQSAAHVPEALPVHKAGRTANMHACCFCKCRCQTDSSAAGHSKTQLGSMGREGTDQGVWAAICPDSSTHPGEHTAGAGSRAQRPNDPQLVL